MIKSESKSERERKYPTEPSERHGNRESFDKKKSDEKTKRIEEREKRISKEEDQ